jgi:hypothetical protein
VQVLAYFEGAVELHRPDIEWFLQLSHCTNSVDASWIQKKTKEAKKKAKDEEDGGDELKRHLSFLKQHNPNESMAVHRTTVMDGGPDSASKVVNKSFELFGCRPSHILHVFLFWRKKTGGSKRKITTPDSINDFTLAGSGVLPMSRLEARGGRFTVELSVCVRKRRLSSGSFWSGAAGGGEPELFSGDIKKLVEMGFNAGRAAKALSEGGGVDAAAAILIERGELDGGGEEEEAEDEAKKGEGALVSPTSPAYVSLAISPSSYPSSRALQNLHNKFLLVDAPNLVNLVDTGSSWNGDALNNINQKVSELWGLRAKVLREEQQQQQPLLLRTRAHERRIAAAPSRPSFLPLQYLSLTAQVHAMCVSSHPTCRQAVSICSQNQDVIQWEFQGGRKVNSNGLLEEWAWRVEDGCGLYSACTAFVSGGGRAGEGELICCGGTDGGLCVYKSDGLTDEPMFSGKGE